jgi:transposase-like protein
MFKGVSLFAFNNKFKTDEDSYQYLAEIKWASGYCCVKCGHTKYHHGRLPHARECNRCHYDESPKANTLFHKVKFGLYKAFYLAFLVSTSKKGISSYELSRKLDMRQKTCWLFKRKVMEAMKSGGQYPLTGRVEVDEFVVGGPEEKSPGRSKGDKTEVVIAVERRGKGLGRCYAQVIPSAHSRELLVFFDKHVAANAQVRTDGWSGYAPLKEYFPSLEQEGSDKGKNFPHLHRQIMMFKSWLRGIHHRCKHLQAYLNEYVYRANRLKSFDTIFHNIVSRMMAHPPMFYKSLKIQ